jgi:hypothetical protein
MLNENHITELLAEYFIANDYLVVEKLTTSQKGIDLVVKNTSGILTYIEIKGETSADSRTKRFGMPFSKDQIKNHVGRALLATFNAMNKFTEKESEFAMGFPDTVGHAQVLNNIKPVMDSLNITIYLISDKAVRLL